MVTGKVTKHVLQPGARDKFSDLQNEQRALVDKGFYLLYRYQVAIASRNLASAMEMNDLLTHLKDALDELCLTEYAIRELFYSDSPARFLSIIHAV